jgi:hypothetical protein
MRTSELRGWLEQLEDAAAPEPSPVFVAKLEADLRAMGQPDGVDTGEAPRSGHSRRARVLLAAAPVAALTAAAAAAAMTLLPAKPNPRQVKTADPGVTTPAPPPEQPPSSVPTPTMIAPPPWLPPTAAPPAASPPTTAAVHTAPVTVAPGPGEHPTPTIVAPREPVSTTVPPVTTTTVPAPETLTLHCTAGMANGNPVVGCTWSPSTSASFKWYRLWRESQGSPMAIVFQSDSQTTTKYYDQAVQAGTNYYYKVDVTDAAGNVIGTSAVAPVTCC